MPRISALTGKTVLLLKKTKKDKDGSVTEKYQKFGRVRSAVFAPDGKRVVGFVVKRPDVAGMIKRGDAFLALDSFESYDEKSVVVTRQKDGLDDAALKRLGVDWDSCIIWSGMDARTTDGKSLGYVSDVEYGERCARQGRRLQGGEEGRRRGGRSRGQGLACARTGDWQGQARHERDGRQRSCSRAGRAR